MTLTIITPEKELLKETIRSVTLPTESGEITVLPNHMPLITALTPGEIMVKFDNGVRHIAVHGGFAEVNADRVRILADAAELSEDIDERRAEEALSRAQKAKEEVTSHQEYAEVSIAIERALARLKVVRRKRKH